MATRQLRSNKITQNILGRKTVESGICYVHHYHQCAVAPGFSADVSRKKSCCFFSVKHDGANDIYDKTKDNKNKTKKTTHKTKGC